MSETRLTLRQRQAKATRGLIIEAAQNLFLERGYTNTTIETIADQAGVAVSTIYASFSSKRGILRAIREAWHNQSHIREFLSSDQSDSAPELRLERLALATRLQWETGLEVINIYRGAAAADREAAAELAEALEGRRKSLDVFTHSLEAHLRPNLDIQHAAAILRTLCQAEVYEELVKRSGWTPEAYHNWLTAVLRRELLEENN